MAAEAAEFDVVVVGSGAAGMTAALTAAHHGLSVVLVEKTGYFGGSTARSGSTSPLGNPTESPAPSVQLANGSPTDTRTGCVRVSVAA